MGKEFLIAIYLLNICRLIEYQPKNDLHNTIPVAAILNIYIV